MNTNEELCLFDNDVFRRPVFLFWYINRAGRLRCVHWLYKLELAWYFWSTYVFLPAFWTRHKEKNPCDWDQVALFPTSKVSPVLLFTPPFLHPVCKDFSWKTGPFSNGRNSTSFLRPRDGHNSLQERVLVGKVPWYHVINKSHCSPVVNKYRITSGKRH